jgi:hypothetical protein
MIRVQADLKQSAMNKRLPKRVKKIRADRCLTIREIAEEVNIFFGLCQAILTEDLAMRRIATKFLPALFSHDRKSRHLKVCEELKRRVEMEPHFISLS